MANTEMPTMRLKIIRHNFFLVYRFKCWSDRHYRIIHTMNQENFLALSCR